MNSSPFRSIPSGRVASRESCCPAIPPATRQASSARDVRLTREENRLLRWLPYVIVGLLTITLTSHLSAQPPAVPVPASPDGAQSTPAPTGDAAGDGRSELPKLEDLSWPEPQSLLEQAPEDWILLFGGRVLKMPGIWPRPDHLQWLQEGQKKFAATRPTDPNELPAWLDEYRRFTYLQLTVEDEGIEDEYQLPTRLIDRIYYHEDLMLLQAAEQIQQGELETARTLIARVSANEASHNRRRVREQLKPLPWPGLLEAERNLLVAEVELALREQLWEKAFALLRNHHQHDATFDQLPELAGKIVDQFNAALRRQKDYRQLRFYLNQTAAMFPAQPRWQAASSQLQRLAEETLSQAEQAFRQRDYRRASLLGQQSLSIWPTDNSLLRRWQPLQERYPVLRTGYLEHQAVLAAAHRRLLHQEWFGVDSIREGYPRFRSRFVESWVPDDLGRGVTLTMRQRHQPFESQPVVNSSDLLNQLQAATVTPALTDRGLFAPQVLQIAQRNPQEVQLEFRTAMPHPLGWLAGVLHHAGPADSRLLADSPFRRLAVTETLTSPAPHTQLVRSFAPQLTTGRWPLMEVQEFLYPEPVELLRALLRDQIDYVPDVPTELVPTLREDPRFTVQRYQLPRLLMLQFPLEGELRTQPEMRLALCSLLNREELLDRTQPPNAPGRESLRLTSSLIASASHAALAAGPIVDFDPIAGRALLAVLHKNPQSPRHLRLGTDDSREAQQLAAQVAAIWTRFGIKTDVLPGSGAAGSGTDDSPQPRSGGMQPDVVIRSVCLIAPHYELPALLTSNGKVSQLQLSQFPLAIRQPLQQLELARDWPEVNRALRDLQSQLLLEAWMLPFWERDVYAVIRREARSIPTEIHTPFQLIDRWTITPVVPRL